MAELQLRVGECVHYGSHGVCRVCDREVKDFGKSKREYFLLRPASDEKMTLFLPVDADPEKVKVRRILSKEEIEQLVSAENQTEEQWIQDSKLRREWCGKILRSGDASQLIAMVKCIHNHERQLPEGKSLPMSDLELVRSAERQLYDEFHYVLHMEKEDLLPFIYGTAN